MNGWVNQACDFDTDMYEKILIKYSPAYFYTM